METLLISKCLVGEKVRYDGDHCKVSTQHLENLRKHQEEKHKDFFEYHENGDKRGPAPGDVSIF